MMIQTLSFGKTSCGKEVKKFGVDPLCGEGTGDQHCVDEGTVTISGHVLARRLDETGYSPASVLKDIKEALFDS